MLVDEVRIKIKAGKGGDGKVNFHREKFVPKGGPDGGDGGNGGDVYFIGVSDITALSRFRFQKEFHAQDGRPGGANKKTGASGKNLAIGLPVGTFLKDLRTAETWEVTTVDQEILIASGGKGGRGNWHFRSSTNQTPMEYEGGESGEERSLYLELRLIADIGLIGLPNVGKSSLLNELTKANVKTAPYHFTTLEPNLGVMDGGIIIADLPGLIEGAHEGRGLGFKFLKHIKRTKALIHCLEVDSSDPLKDYEMIRKELADFDKELTFKQEIILLTKTDLLEKGEIQKVKKKLVSTGREILACSVYDYDSLEKLKKRFKKFKG